MARAKRMIVLMLASAMLTCGWAWGLPRFHPRHPWRDHRRLLPRHYFIPPPNEIEIVPGNSVQPSDLGEPEFGPPAVSAPPPAAPSLTPTLPEGMAITINKTLSDKQETGDRPAAPTISRPRQAAEQLATCWRPPLPDRGDTVEATLRFGFDKQGDVLWPPNVTYVKAGHGTVAKDVRESILDAIKACTPLKFTDSMAANMPGYPLAVRFIGRREDERQESR